MMMMMI